MLNRYKIVVLATDATEAFNFILKDRAAKRLIGQTATKLISDTINVCTKHVTKFLHVFVIMLITVLYCVNIFRKEKPVAIQAKLMQ